MSKYTTFLLLVSAGLFSVGSNAGSEVSVVTQSDILDVHQISADNYSISLSSSTPSSDLNIFNAHLLEVQTIKSFEQDGSFFKPTDFSNLNSSF